MEIHPYFIQFLVSLVSTLIIFLVILYTTRNIRRSSQLRMLTTLVLSVAISVIITLFISNYYWSEIVKNFSLINYNLVEVIISWVLTTVIFGFFIKDYLFNKNYFLTWLVVLSSYIITNYWITPTLINFLKSIIN